MKNVFNLRTLIVMALLAALCAVFSAFMAVKLSFAGIKTVEVSLAPVPVMLAGIFFGPLAGGLVGFVGEAAGYFMGMEAGAYNPAFSLVMALFGVIAGLFYLRSQKDSGWKVIGVVITGLLVCTVTLTTLLIRLFYGLPLALLLPTRLVCVAIELPFYVLLLMALVKSLRPIVNKRFRPKAAV